MGKATFIVERPNVMAIAELASQCTMSDQGSKPEEKRGSHSAGFNRQEPGMIQ
jgi:hypothetical protein